ncbi:hypothetical protein Sgleb_59520 [Streptomyces glebosus]|uniref:Uncharacterized protein n=1 Tax=Streptomyces glebosus TaxID=249580 RepID=A0A640T8C5_9ACTN|nr:hypothetical protein Sgleb_59520 [Streptomyces glebosus]
MCGEDRFAVGGEQESAPLVAGDEVVEEHLGSLEVAVPGVGSCGPRLVWVSVRSAVGCGLHVVPGLAVGLTVNGSIEAGFNKWLQAEDVSQDLCALLEAQAGAGVERGEGLDSVLGSQLGCRPLDLEVPEAGEPGAGCGSADTAVDVAPGLAVADEDEFCGDHEVPWNCGR